MSLEEKIQELEKKLALKQAYLSVNFTFPRGNRIPDEIKEQVTSELKNACAQLAEHEEYDIPVSVNLDGTPSQASNFTPEEVEVLKGVAASVFEKTTDTGQSPKPQSKSRKDSISAKKARIIMLDSVDKTVRSKIEPQSEVKVIASGQGKHFVQTMDGAARRFWINTDDLDFNV